MLKDEREKLSLCPENLYSPFDLFVMFPHMLSATSTHRLTSFWLKYYICDVEAVKNRNEWVPVHVTSCCMELLPR